MAWITFDHEKCNSCGMCILECPAGIIKETEGAAPAGRDRGEEFCIACGHCVAVCPLGAVATDKMKPEECDPVKRGLLPSPEQVDMLMRSRRSVRAYRDEPVPKEVLVGLIDVARWAPSGHNAQPLAWTVVESREEVRRLAGLTMDWVRKVLEDAPRVGKTMHFDWMVARWERGQDPVTRGAPHLVLAHAPKSSMVASQAATIALTYLELAAWSRGLGTCWAGWLHAASTTYPPLTEALALPEGHQCMGAMMVGYPKHKFRLIPQRKEAEISWR